MWRAAGSQRQWLSYPNDEAHAVQQSYVFGLPIRHNDASSSPAARRKITDTSGVHCVWRSSGLACRSLRPAEAVPPRRAHKSSRVIYGLSESPLAHLPFTVGLGLPRKCVRMGGESMPLSVSQADIEGRIVEYFAWRFRTPATPILTSANFKRRLHFTDNAWAGLALTFSSMAWMKKIRVSLAPAEMGKVSTLLELSTLIWKKVPKLVWLSISAPHSVSRSIRRAIGGSTESRTGQGGRNCRPD